MRSCVVRTNRTYVELEEGERERAGAESIKQRQAADNEEEATTNGNIKVCIHSILF